MEAAKVQTYQHKEIKYSKKNSPQNPEKTYSSYIYDFSEYLLNHNYAPSTIPYYKKKTKKFIKDLSTLFNINVQTIADLNNLTSDHMTAYEKFLLQRINNKEIKIVTAYSYIRNAKLFLQFLNSKNIITFRYLIPQKLMVDKATRTNTYITNVEIQSFINFIINDKSQYKYRNLAIVLILIETGCRPIELSNLRIKDLKLSERQIVLYSVKSGKRVMAINHTLVKVLRRYLCDRKDKKIKTDALFLKENDTPVDSSYISTLMRELNHKAFQKCVINAKSLRHTFATNAFENKNEINAVSESMGHKYQVSTLYYLHKSTERLLANTLKYDPTICFTKEKKQWP